MLLLCSKTRLITVRRISPAVDYAPVPLPTRQATLVCGQRFGGMHVALLWVAHYRPAEQQK